MRTFAAFALAAMLLPAASSTQAETRVFRCEDQGRVTYSDVECPRAKMLTLDGGAPAPDARERLRRDQDALDAGAAARRDVLAREAALARMQRADGGDVPPARPAADQTVYDFAYGPAGTLRNDARRRAGRERERDRERDRVRRHASVIPQPPPTPLRGSPR